MDYKVVFLVSLVLIAVGSIANGTNAEESLSYITEYNVPSPRAGPLAISVDGSDNVWFTESNASRLAVFFPSNRTFREVAVSNNAVEMWGITHDQDNRVWFTMHERDTHEGFVGNYNPVSGMVQLTSLGNNNSFPMRIIYGKDRNIWFTEFNANRLGKLEPSTGKITLYALPESNSGPVGLSWDSSGKIWVSLALQQEIASFNTADATFRTYRANFPIFSPVGIAPDLRGNVWFADHGGSWIVRLTPTENLFEKFPTSTPPVDVYPISIPNDLKISAEGIIWFTEHGGNKIGRLDPKTLTLIEYHVPTGPIATVFWFDFDSAGNVWFTEFDGNKIGHLVKELSMPFSVVLSPMSLVISPDGSATADIELDNNLPTTPILEFQASQTGNDLHATFSDLRWSSNGKGLVKVQFYADSNASPVPRRMAITATDGFVTIGKYLDMTIQQANIGTIPIPLPFFVASIALASAGAFLVYTRLKRRQRQLDNVLRCTLDEKAYPI